jgi:hypothetical protein
LEALFTAVTIPQGLPDVQAEPDPAGLAYRGAAQAAGARRNIAAVASAAPAARWPIESATPPEMLRPS